MSFWKNDFSALFKFYELEIWMYCMHTAHSLQGGHSRDWWARLSTPVLSVCPVFILVGIVSLANGRTANDGNPIHTWLTAPVKSCAVVTFPSMSFSSKLNCPQQIAGLFGCRFCPVAAAASHFIKKWRGGRAADRFFHVVEKWQTTYLCRPACCAAVDSSGNAISARHLGRPPLLLAIYIIPADSRGIFQKRRDDPSSFPVLQSIVLRGNIAARLMHNKFHTMLSNQQELSDVTAGSLYRECRWSNHLTIETSV